MVFYDDIQRAFYSCYFAGHGLKVQVVFLPNGMIGAIYLASWRVSDAGVYNMSGLDAYLSNLFREFQMGIPQAQGQYPALYGDGTFPWRATMVSRLQGNTIKSDRRINTLMSSVRQSVEHLFCLHKNIFKLFNQPERFRLLVHGNEARKLIFNSFFLLNCYICLNESPNNFMARPPTIEEYLPLDEQLQAAPEVTDAHMGEYYRYHTRSNN